MSEIKVAKIKIRITHNGEVFEDYVDIEHLDIHSIKGLMRTALDHVYEEGIKYIDALAGV